MKASLPQAIDQVLRSLQYFKWDVCAVASLECAAANIMYPLLLTFNPDFKFRTFAIHVLY